MTDIIEIELYPNERDLLLRFRMHMLYDDIVQIIVKSRKRKNGYYYVSFSHNDLDDLVGNLSFIVNHEDDHEESGVILELNDLADRFENHLQRY